MTETPAMTEQPAMTEEPAGVETSRWTPLLEGRRGEQALEAAAAIARDLAAMPEAVTQTDVLYPHSLAYGEAGIALFLHYWDRAVGDTAARDAMQRYLSQAQAGLAGGYMLPDLYRGFSGVCWAMQHIRAQRGVAPGAGFWRQIDAGVESWAGREGTPTELLEGLGGALLYSAEHGRREGTDRVFARSISRLAGIADLKGRGRAWPVSDTIQENYEWHLTLSSKHRFTLADDWLQKGMTGYYKMSYAHGCIGTAAALACAIAAGFDGPRARDMASSAAEFVLELELPPGAASIFPNVPGTALPKWTGGWCDGDAAIAMAILLISDVVGREDLRAEALRVARLEAGRRREDVESPNRDNYMLCHGSSGRAHIFNRLYQCTGESLFAETALYWYDQTLATRVPGRGTGGFLVDEKREDGKLLDVHGFLMGAAGLGLALTAGCFDIEPEWDRALGLSVRVL